MIKKRQTVSKRKVLDFFKKHDHAISHELIEQGLSGSMDRVTIYRILKSFEEDGLIHKIVDENSKSHYALCQECNSQHVHNHMHFQCTNCEKVECLDYDLEVPMPNGYQLKNMQLIASGLCKDCVS
ncbi:MAG: transcriptional repressor [Crocinitomicaceae bacterium]|nr:transcriptional repressor [Crocinitomicaceae bacterium]